MNETGTGNGLPFVSSSMVAVDILDELIEHAAKLRASDVHIDPDREIIRLRYRIDGQMENAGILDIVIHEELIARLKILSGARTDLHAIPQDGRFRKEANGEPYNIRVSFMPTFFGENAVVRLLPSLGKSTDSLVSLGFCPDQVRQICEILSYPNGLILVTGPTGCGKTTTLRVCLEKKASEQISVLTLEDPVEYVVSGVRHIHIREIYGVNFSSGLRSALRQDPDVIMLGEIRDNETAKTAVQTALTGHLVLSTLHTRSALDTIIRLQNMGVEKYLISATLRMVISQRLVRLICEECGGFDPYGQVCHGNGFKGRSVIAEVIVIDDSLRDLINHRSDSRYMSDYLLSHGFRALADDAAEKIEWGLTTQGEVLKALNS